MNSSSISYVSKNILSLRKQRGINQEVLAKAFDVSIQTISKWETGKSLPDIGQLPRIAKYFNVTIDYLFSDNTNASQTIKQYASETADKQNGLRILQCMNGKILDEYEYDKKVSVNIVIPEVMQEDRFLIEAYGNVTINGNLIGDIKAEGSVNCENTTGDVISGQGLNCGNVTGNVKGLGGVSCGNVIGNVTTEKGISCGNVKGEVTAGTLSCSDIDGDVKADTIKRCKSIKGNVTCDGNITYVKSLFK